MTTHVCGGTIATHQSPDPAAGDGDEYSPEAEVRS